MEGTTVVAEGNDLVLQINGGKVVVQGYFTELAQGDLPTFTDLPGGTGVVITQSPAPGVTVSYGDTIQLFLL